jgi:hypothetical protein
MVSAIPKQSIDDKGEELKLVSDFGVVLQEMKAIAQMAKAVLICSC